MGEPTSSSPNFTGEESEARLPYSGVQVSISNRYWQGAQAWDTRAWLPIDIPAPLTFDAYIAGRDPTLEAITAVIATR